MSRRLVAAAAAGVLLVIGAVIAALVLRGNSAAGPRGEVQAKPELLLLSALPIVFAEELTLEGGGSPALSALERHYRVRPISTAHAGNLQGARLLLMAQPQAQPAEALVELDRWVRDGGHLVLLADPVLHWPSELPLGDLRRPPFAFADTGLLGHWGLRLDAPDTLGPVSVDVGGTRLHTVSPGSLVSTGDACEVEAAGLLARCDIGEGRATIIADADFIDVERRRDPQRTENLRLLHDELKRLDK